MERRKEVCAASALNCWNMQNCGAANVLTGTISRSAQTAEYIAISPIFGIIQIVLGIQFSMFPAIGLMKVRKPGSLLFIAVFSGIVLVFMNQIIFFCLALCAILAEAVTLIIFKSYEKDAACFMAGALYLPLSLPFLYVWYRIVGGTDTVLGSASTTVLWKDSGESSNVNATTENDLRIERLWSA